MDGQGLGGIAKKTALTKSYKILSAVGSHYSTRPEGTRYIEAIEKESFM